jgi:hypothetical protein
MPSDKTLPDWAARLQTERDRRGWNKHEMARRLLDAAGIQQTPIRIKSLVRQVSWWEHGKHYPRDWDTIYATAFETTVAQLFGTKPAYLQTATARSVDGEGARDEWDDDVERRALLQLLAALSTQGTIPVGALEAVRAGLDRALGAADDHAVEDWEQISYEYGCALLSGTPAGLIAALATDIVDVRSVLRNRPELDLASMQRVSARLAALMASALSEMGALLDAARWWRTARGAADASGDLDLRVWVRGRQALVTQTTGRPELAVYFADRAIGLAADRPLAGLAEAYATRAKVSAAGRQRTALRDLETLERLFARLPVGVTDERSAVWGYPEERLMSSRTGVLVSLGHEDVHDDLVRELSACTRSRQRARAELKMGWYLVNTGDIKAGAERSATVLSALPAEHRTTSVMRMAKRVVTSLPDEQATGPAAVRELRRLTAESFPEGHAVGRRPRNVKR